MYADNSILSKDASAFAKAYKSSANDVVTEFVNLSGITRPSLTEQFELFDSLAHESDRHVVQEQIRPTDKRRYAGFREHRLVF